MSTSRPGTLNLGILAHVDAGKTSLTERLLYAAGVIDEVGSVDHGSTQTDSLALERRRGITIKSAVVSFPLDGVTVNLIDTPGHPDFIAEVERVLGVLDGAVLVVSAVEGVQAQTRVLMRTLRRLGIPTLIFVNKIDRTGARADGVRQEILERLTTAAVPMGTVRDQSFEAAEEPAGVDLLADHDDGILAAYVHGTVAPQQLRRALRRQSRAGLVHPVFFGSAITGAGVPELMAGIRELLPARAGDVVGPVSGTVFKVERGPAGEKIAYVRMFAGTLHTRDRPRVNGHEAEKITAIGVFEHGGAVRRPEVSAGQIGKLWGLGDVRIGDPVGVPRSAARVRFAPPTLETVVEPDRPADRGRLFAALVQLAEQDPLINLRRDDLRQELHLSLYGEVQKDVIQATLAEEYGVAVSFRETTTIHVERLIGTGEAVEFLGAPDNPFLATIGLRIEPGEDVESGEDVEPGEDGITFRLGVELGSMPPAFFKAVEETVRETLGQGLHGWEIPDCVVTMTHSGYLARQSRMHGGFDKSMSSTAGDFRNLTPLVLMTALRRAGTGVYEPIHRFHLELPADLLGPVLPALAQWDAVPQATTIRGAVAEVEGETPAARVHGLQRQLPGLTRGEGVLECAFARYRPVRGVPPSRPRTDHNPLDRKEYLLRVVRKTGA